MKKLLLGLGTIAAVVAPVTAVVACSKDEVFDGLAISYDSKTKLITMDFKKVALLLKETAEYKTTKVKLDKQIEAYNANPTQANEDTLKATWHSINDMTGEYMGGLTAKAFKGLYERYGKAIIDHPDAIGILIEDRASKLDFKDGKYSLLNDQSLFDLKTFNKAPSQYVGDDTDEIENFMFGLGEAFVMPEHGKWTTSAEFLKGITEDEYDKTLTKLRTQMNEKTDGLTDKQLAIVSSVKEKLGDIINNPSPAAKLYFYLMSTGTDTVTTDQEWITSHTK